MVARIHTKFAGEDLWRRVSCERQFILFFSAHLPARCTVCVVSVDSARMTDSS